MIHFGTREVYTILLFHCYRFLGAVQDHRMCYAQLTNEVPSLEIIQVKSSFCFTKTFQEPDYLERLIHHCNGSILSKKSMLHQYLFLQPLVAQKWNVMASQHFKNIHCLGALQHSCQWLHKWCFDKHASWCTKRPRPASEFATCLPIFLCFIIPTLRLNWKKLVQRPSV